MTPKVLMFGWEFPPDKSGGLGTACLGLTRALSNKDVDVTFVLPKKTTIEADHAKFVFADNDKTLSKVKFRKISSIIQPYITSDGYIKELDRLKNVAAHSIYGETLMDEVYRYALNARAIAESEDFDVIHAHDWLSFAAGIEAKRVTGKPLIAQFHATEWDRSGGQGANPDVYKLEQEAILHADCIVAVSNHTKQILVTKYGADERKVEVVHNGIEPPMTDDFSQTLQEYKAGGTKIILSLGRITIQKGVDYFIRTARTVIDHYNKDVIFVVVGSGDMHKQMIDLAAELNISDKVLFTGWFDEKQAMQMYRTADLFVMPSVSEPFGLVPMEAALQGTPSLISRQSGVSEVLTDCLKTDYWDTDAMANQIVSLLEHDSLQRTLTNNVAHEVKQLTWDTPARKCINLYNRLIKTCPVIKTATA